jgi:hypothetical protein
MDGLNEQIFQRWSHSFEEDMGGLTIYRPPDYNFPRVRGGREGIEFQEDGTFILYTPGPADASSGIYGRWQVDESGLVRISFPDNGHAPMLLEILQCTSEILQVRQHDA